MKRSPWFSRRTFCVSAAIGLFAVVSGSSAFPSIRAADAALSGDHLATGQGDLILHPIHHATFAIAWNHRTIYVDPVGGEKPFAGLPRPASFW
jgi:hypothetical protein